MLTPTGPVGQTHWGDSMANNPMPATHSADAQLKASFYYYFIDTNIFKLLNCKLMVPFLLLKVFGVVFTARTRRNI